MMDSSQKSILVIEDETDIRDSISEILGFEGYQVQTAENGFAGIEKIAENKDQLIF